MRKPIITDRAAPPKGSYSQAVQAGNFIFFSGQLPKEGGDIYAQTKQVMDNLAGILASQQMTFDHVVETAIYVTDISNLSAVDSVYAEYFDPSSGFPARSAIAVSALPQDALVEISAVARLL